MNYRPVGTSVLLKRLPPTNTKSPLVLPDGKNHPNEIQHFEIVSVGAEVNDDKFTVNAGEVCILGGIHPSEAIWIDVREHLLVVDRRKIVAIVETKLGIN